MTATEYFGNTLCIKTHWLIENSILSKSNYKQLSRRNAINIVRRGCRNTPALVAYDSIPPRFQNKIVELLGSDPHKTTKGIQFREYLVHDPNAKQFYDDYRFGGDGACISESRKAQYIAEAEIFNAVNAIISNRLLKRRVMGKGGKPWPAFAKVIKDLDRQQWPHKLPKNHRSLRRKFNKYKGESAPDYKSLIHGGHGNINSEKINDDAKLWLINRWGDQVKKVAGIYQLFLEYNEKAIEVGWKQLEDEESIRNFLFNKEIEPLWYAKRYGTVAAKEKYTYHHTTKLPTMRDSLWYSDGTKMNLFFLDENGKRATINVYEVIDAYSQVWLGCSFGEGEDYEMKYKAYKSAAQFAGHRPYQITFDNQGGTRQTQTKDFFGKLSRLAINTKPYNGKSKTIESAFGRFQQDYLKQLWFCTGQNITATKKESKARMEFILTNTKDLPTRKEAIAAYMAMRKKWNEAPRRKGEKNRRIDLYNDSENPESPEITVFDMVDMFWLQREKPVTYRSGGLAFTHKKQVYEYVVYDDNREIDMNFHRNNQGQKFVIKFDPEDMSMVYLYEKTPLGLRFATAAETKVTIARGRQEITKFEDEYRQMIERKNKESLIDTRDKMERIMDHFHSHPEDYGLKAQPLKGIENRRKKGKKKTETKKKQPVQVESESIGQYQKNLSNAVPEDEIWDMV